MSETVERTDAQSDATIATKEDWTAVSLEEFKKARRENTVMGREKRRRRTVAGHLLDWEAVDEMIEIGVGMGEFIGMARKQAVEERHAVDINETFLAAVDGMAHTYHSDATSLPFDDAAVDAVVSLGLLGHLPSEYHVRAALSEFARVVEPGGQIVVSVGNNGVARRVRTMYQRLRIIGKTLTGLGEPEAVFETLGPQFVVEEIEHNGATVVEAESITFTPGIVDGAELRVADKIDALLEGAWRRRLGQTTVLRAEMADSV